MIDFNLIKIGFTLGPSINISPRGTTALPGKLGRLYIPWIKDLQTSSDVLSLLSWRTFLSDFRGFDEQIIDLHQWAASNPRVSVKFITGQGGVGKTRTAAEFARTLEKGGWNAGFVDMRRPQSYTLSKKGNLLIVDYPEEHRSSVCELLTDLADLKSEDCPPLRVLFLTRRRIDDWLELVYESKAGPITDMEPVTLLGLSGEDAYSVFCSAQRRAAMQFGSTPIPVSEEQIIAWTRLASEHEHALFIVAAAVYSAIHPKEVVVQYSGKEVVQAIANRELASLRRVATDSGLNDQNVLARILSVSSITGSVSSEFVLQIASNSPALLGLQQGENVTRAIEAISVGPEKLIPAPKPDILAAAMMVRTLSEVPGTAPELLWAGINPDISGGLDRIARLSYDAEVTLGIHEHRLSEWLAKSVEGRRDRCEILQSYFSDPDIPIGWISASVAVWRTLLGYAKAESERASSLINLSRSLRAVGDIAGALEATREAIEIYRCLANASPTLYEPNLAASLNNLSHCLGDAGDNAGALGAIREAVEIHRRLSEAFPAQYEPDLAMSLNNLSVRLSNAGDNSGAFDAIRDAVEVYRRLAETSPIRYEPDLATSLNNLSNRLSAAGDNAGALDTIRDAVDIRRRLAEASPARYEPDLAGSLNNFSNYLNTAGDNAGALEVIREAVDIYRRLAEASPARYEPDLAGSLINLSNYLSDAGDNTTALGAIRETVEVYRRLAKASPVRYEPELAMSLNSLSNCLGNAGDNAGALGASRKAIEIYRRLAEASPTRYKPNLAGCLITLSGCLSAAGDKTGALGASRESVKILRHLTEDSHTQYEPNLAKSLNSLSSCLDAVGDNDGALKSARKAMEIYRRLAEVSPARHEPNLALSLNNLSCFLDYAGNNAGALEVIRESIEIYRRLAKASPAQYELDLAKSLTNLGITLRRAGDHRHAKTAFKEAAALMRSYANQQSDGPHLKLLRHIESQIRGV